MIIWKMVSIMNKEPILKQIEKVIVLLKQHLEDDPNRPILNTLHTRYLKAKEILSNDKDIDKIMINGGCRAYLDAFSDYWNPILAEMYKLKQCYLK